jgi:hypothetical protein
VTDALAGPVAGLSTIAVVCVTARIVFVLVVTHRLSVRLARLILSRSELIAGFGFLFLVFLLLFPARAVPLSPAVAPSAIPARITDRRVRVIVIYRRTLLASRSNLNPPYDMPDYLSLGQQMPDALQKYNP